MMLGSGIACTGPVVDSGAQNDQIRKFQNFFSKSFNLRSFQNKILFFKKRFTCFKASHEIVSIIYM